MTLKKHFYLFDLVKVQLQFQRVSVVRHVRLLFSMHVHYICATGKLMATLPSFYSTYIPLAIIEC